MEKVSFKVSSFISIIFLDFQSSLKTTFKTLVVTRLPTPEEPSGLSVTAVTKERNKRGLGSLFLLFFFI